MQNYVDVLKKLVPGCSVKIEFDFQPEKDMVWMWIHTHDALGICYSGRGKDTQEAFLTLIEDYAMKNKKEMGI